MQIANTLRNDRARLDTELLLSFVLKKPRTWILAHTEYTLSSAEEKLWQTVLERRRRGEPVAYITGEKEFFGRSFFVDTSTLIPRPATETLVEQALKVLKGSRENTMTEADTDICIVTNLWNKTTPCHTVVDIGTGSGCIAITLACEMSSLEIIATDVSKNALTIAQKNAERYQVTNRITFTEGSVLAPIANLTTPFLVVSNPPYIPEGMKLMQDVQDFEPHSALFSGKEGSDVIKDILIQAKAHPYCIGVVIECRREHVKEIVLAAEK